MADYLDYFIKLAKLNGWNYETCGLQLATSLTLDDVAVLSALPPEQSEDLQFLVQALYRWHYPMGQEAQHSFELMSRTWDIGKEFVSEYANGLTRLARRAHSHGWVPEKIMVS